MGLKNMYECKADFDTITVKGLGEVVCPRVASICPSIGCPAHCSGAGFCNWNNKPGPKFICFDPDDDTEGCYGDMKREGGKGGRKGGSSGVRFATFCKRRENNNSPPPLPKCTRWHRPVFPTFFILTAIFATCFGMTASL